MATNSRPTRPASPAETVQPDRGGRYVRNADGTLTRLAGTAPIEGRVAHSAQALAERSGSAPAAPQTRGDNAATQE